LGVNTGAQAQPAPVSAPPPQSTTPGHGQQLNTDTPMASTSQQEPPLQQPATAEPAQQDVPDAGLFCVTVVLTGK
jgi:hypothetical protein